MYARLWFLFQQRLLFILTTEQVNEQTKCFNFYVNESRHKNYDGDPNVLQYFVNVRKNSVAPVSFAKVVTVTIHSGLWDAELTWYSPRATRQICLYDLEHGRGIYAFRPIGLWLIVKVLAIWLKFLQPSSYCFVINCAFTFHTTTLGGVLPRRSDPELNYAARSSMQLSNHTRNEPMHNVSAHQLPRFYQLRRVPLTVRNASVTLYTSSKLARTKILQNFWLTIVVIICVKFPNHHIHYLIELIFHNTRPIPVIPASFV